MTQPSPRPQRTGSFASVALKLLGSSLLLWLPLIGWELGELWSANDSHPRNRPPGEWSAPLPPKPGAGAMAGAAIPGSQPVLRLPGSPLVVDPMANRRLPAMPAPSLSKDALGVSLFTPAAGSGAFRGAGLTETSPWLLTAMRGAAGLGGEINLDNVNEKVMPMAALAERQYWQNSGDPLSPLPRHWRDELRREVGNGNKLVQAAVVRIPAPHLKTAEEIPLAIHANGQAASLVSPPSARSQQVVEAWASRQSPVKEGEVRAVVVTLEPIELANVAPPEPAPPGVPMADSVPAPLEQGSASDSALPLP